jgi:hypothetical protein
MVTVNDLCSAPVPRCFEVLWDEDTKTWHLLLEDLTDSHVIATTWPLPPTFEQCESILRARARFHAAWWDDLPLGASVGNWLDTGGWISICKSSRNNSLALPTALVTSCHASGAIFTNYCSPRGPVYSNAITRTVTSRSSDALVSRPPAPVRAAFAGSLSYGAGGTRRVRL